MSRKHFVLCGYIVRPFVRFKSRKYNQDIQLCGSWTHRNDSEYKMMLSWYKRYFHYPPRNYIIHKFSSGAVVRICYINLDIGHFTISANNIRDAYDVSDLVIGYMSSLRGYSVFNSREGHWYLYEMNKLPSPTWNMDTFYRNIIPTPGNTYEDKNRKDLETGVYVQPDDIKYLINLLKQNDVNHKVINALRNLTTSYHLFGGYMNDSYYQYHYQYDRKMLTPDEIEKYYREYRGNYELSYVSAFKGIESLLGVNQIREKDISALLRKYYPQLIGKQYQRFHEIFSSHQKMESYEKVISWFLKLRNIVAAHSNSNPPPIYALRVDNIYEIQLFLSNLIEHSVPNWERYEAPSKFFLRLKGKKIPALPILTK